jgi:hypothetical protein
MKRAALVLVPLFVAATAHAGVEARFAFAFASPGTPVHYVYRISLVSGSLEPGATVSQHVTLYDIPSLIADSVSCPAEWTASTQTRGVNADDIPLNGKQDSARVLNLTCTWNGAATLTAPAELGIVTFDIEVGSGSVTSGSFLFAGQSSTFFGARGLIGRNSGPASVTP